MIPGLGGMGKSRLARAYVHEAIIHGVYDAILWFQLNREVDDTQNRSSLETQYRRWLNLINVKTDETDHVLFDLFKDKISQHYKHSLIIYDDAPSGDFLRGLLPQTNTHILITSRDGLGWNKKEMIPSLEEFQPKESVKFLQQESGRDSEEEKEDALKVAAELGGLPLALEQAASWLRVKSKTYSQYYNEFTTKAEEFMTYKAKGSDYPQVVATTWAVTMNSVSELARKLMKGFAYLRSNDIPLSLFEKLDPEDAIDELVQYSMIKRNDDQISVHQLVQFVNREDDDQEVLQDLVKLFVGKAESLFKLDLNNHQNQDLFLRYSLHAFKLSQYTKRLMKRDDDLLEKFEWARLVVSLGGINTFFQRSRNLQESEKENSATQQILKRVMEEKDLLTQEFKGTENSVAFKWLYKIAEDSHYMIQIIMGLLYKFSNIISCNYEETFKWYRLAAEQGDAMVQYAVGWLYADGKGITRDDVEAVKWYQKAAEQGDVEAQYNLGKNYKDGVGIARNEIEAVKWYQKAAEQGHADAQYWLGKMYESGRGELCKDGTEAVRWYQKAAHQGHVNAHYALGAVYEYGRGGLPKDDTEAVKWYKKAALLGDELAQKKLEKLEGLEEPKEGMNN